MSTLVNNFPRLDNDENAGGAPWFQVVVAEDVDTIPDVISDVIATAITLLAGKTAYNIMATVGTVNWNESTQAAGGRDLHQARCSFIIPKDRADILQYARTLNNKGVVAIVRDANGQNRLMGTKSTPALFRRVTRGLGSIAGDRNQQVYEIVFTSKDPIPFYQVTTHLPVPANAACPPVPSVALAVSNSTPDFGTATTFTATPTDFTPNQHEFIVPTACGDLEKITQASGVYAYTPPAAGTHTIIVVAKDTVSGTSATNQVSITVGTIYAKHGISAAWEAKDIAGTHLVNGKVNKNPDATGNGYIATAPAAVNRLLKYSDPRHASNGMASAQDSNSKQRLVTSLSQLHSTITYFAVFDNTEEGSVGAFSVHAVLGGDATPVSNTGSRYNFLVNTSSNQFTVGVRGSSGSSAAGITTANLAYGKNIVVMTYDGTTLRVKFNGVVQTTTYSGALWTPASCNVVLMNTNISGYTAGSTKPYVVLGVKTSSLSDTDADALYDDLELKYAG